jgi:predicted ribosomally synthesized peptide with nif11-like leader
MASEVVTGFFDEVRKSARLRDKISALPSGESKTGALVAIAAEAGFDFTEEEFETELKEQFEADAGSSEGVLTDDELEGIAGGTSQLWHSGYGIYAFKGTKLPGDTSGRG